MDIQKNNKHTLITLKKNTKTDFFVEFQKKYSTFENDHLIVDLLKMDSFTKKEIDVLIDYGQQKSKNGTSFVVVSKKLDAGNLEGILNVTPTIAEAIDILEMEEIERDLGF